MTEGNPAPLTITQDLLDAINANNVIVVPAGVDRGAYNMHVGFIDEENVRISFIGALDVIYANTLRSNLVVNNTLPLIEHS